MEDGTAFTIGATLRMVTQTDVDNGQVVPAAYNSSATQWGATLGGADYVWRSGLGVTANGALVYVGGPGLNIVDLANILVRAGAVRSTVTRKGGDGGLLKPLAVAVAVKL